MWQALKEMSVELRVLSFGNEEEIRAALRHIEVEDCFEGTASIL